MCNLKFITNVSVLKKGQKPKCMRGVHLFACHYNTQVCRIIIKVYYDKHISVMGLIKAAFNALKAISYQRSWSYSASGRAFGARGLMLSLWGCRELMFHCYHIYCSYSITDTQEIHHYLHRMLDYGLDYMLRGNILDSAANFQLMALKHQPCDVKMKPKCHCLFIYKRVNSSC